MLISQGMMTRAFNDPSFFQRVPEFTPFKAKLKAMHVNYEKPGGCTGCRQKRVQQTLYGNYTTLVQALSPDGLARLKQYFGTQRFMVNVHDEKTNKTSVRIF